MMNEPKNIIISGGGTGGHIFPAIAIAQALKKSNEKHRILFVGAKGKMEMEKVPAAGFEIIGLPVRGFKRSLSLSNINVVLRFLISLFKARRIFRSFKPDLVIGVGGYASGPVVRVAGNKKVPIIIQEQNSFPGVTNRLFGKKVEKILGAYEDLKKYFPEEKIVITGNPVRELISNIDQKKEEAQEFFSLNDSDKCLFVFGGSQGARTINETIIEHIDPLIEAGISLIWQTGKQYYQKAMDICSDKNTDKIHIYEFIQRMDLAYAAADIIVARSGAMSISELCIVGKPVIFIPFPNAAGDHQTKNASSLVDRDAALMIANRDCSRDLVPSIENLFAEEESRLKMSQEIKKMAKPEAIKDIIKSIEEVLYKQ